MTVGVVVKPTQYYTEDTSGIPALRGLNVKPGGFDLNDLVRFRPESAKNWRNPPSDSVTWWSSVQDAPVMLQS